MDKDEEPGGWRERFPESQILKSLSEGDSVRYWSDFSEDELDEVIEKIYSVKCNGNVRDIKDFFDRRVSFEGRRVDVRAERDGGKPYIPGGILVPVFFYEAEDPIPRGLIIECQDQVADWFQKIYFDRTRGILPRFYH